MVAPESDLAARLRTEDGQAYEEVVRQYGGRMLAVTRRILRNEEDARDAVQDALLQAFRRIETFKGDSALGTWLHRIAVNAALMKLRSAKKRDAVSIDSLLPSYHDDGHRVIPEDEWQETGAISAERAETRALVRAAIDQLPDDYRTVLLLRDVEQLDTNETATALGVSTGVIKTRLHRARQALRTLLEQQVREGAL